MKAGTKNLMADFTERNVESLKVGDMILDKDLIQTRVIGVSYEFLMNEKLYGFGDDLVFFTKNHIFLGPSLNKVKSNSDFKLYVKSASTLYYENPLMEYLNVTEIGTNDVSLFHLKKFPYSLDTIKVPVFEDPQSYQMDTPVYYIQVESSSGSYFANGYVCRHDLPPMEHWPNTMSVLLRLINTPSFEKISKLKYSLPVVRMLDEVTNQIVTKVEQYFQYGVEYENVWKVDKDYPLMTLGDVDMEQCIPKLFSNPSVSYMGVHLYAKVGVILAPHLDGTMGISLSESRVAAQQFKLYNVITNELDRLVEEMEREI